MNKSWLVLIIFSVLLSACEVRKQLLPRGAFLGLTPTDKPQLLPRFINSGMIEFNGTFNAEGTEFYYTTDIPRHGMIVHTQMLPDSSWSAPALAAFSGTYSDYDPLFSPDGNRLYFSSGRPAPGKSEGSSGIWFVERMHNGWTDPVYIPLGALSAFYSSVTSKGKVYFNAGSPGKLYSARKTAEQYQVEPLVQMLDSLQSELDPFIAPDESYLIFRGYGDRSYGRADLFISFHLNGQWTPAENLGSEINSTAQEVCPYVTTDGRFFIFSSDRLAEPYPLQPGTPIAEFQDKFGTSDNAQQNIYYMSADFIEDFRKRHISRFGK